MMYQGIYRKKKRIPNATIQVSIALFIYKWHRTEEKNHWLKNKEEILAYYLRAYDSTTHFVCQSIGPLIHQFFHFLVFMGGCCIAAPTQMHG